MLAPIIAAAAIQITNGFFFAKAPYSFSMPLFPEAGVLMASPMKGMDAVSYTMRGGRGFGGKLQIRHKAFTDNSMRHENLLWLAETIGERYGCWQTAISPYAPIEGIDDDIAFEYDNYLNPSVVIPEVHGTYIRTPSHFCNHSSTTQLVFYANSITNLYLPITNGTFGVGGAMHEYDSSIMYDFDDYSEFLSYCGITHVPTNFPAPPTYKSPVRKATFFGMYDGITNVPSAAVFIPIEKLASMSVDEGDLQRVEYEVHEDTCANWYSQYGGTEPAPANLFLLSLWDSGDPDHTPFYAWCVTNGPAITVTTNSVTIVSHVTPESPFTYRDYNYHVQETTEIWNLWMSTVYKPTPWICLTYPDGSIFYDTNRTEVVTVTSDTMPGGDRATFDMFARSSITLGPKMRVQTICSIDDMAGNGAGEPPMYYFRTNTYDLSVTRAVGLDGTAKVVGEGPACIFASLVADVAFSYSVYYAGWIGGSPRQTSGYYKRAFVQFDIPALPPSAGTSRFQFRVEDIFNKAGDVLKSNVCDRVGANFDDIAYSLVPPSWWPSSSGNYTYDFPATRELSLQFSISNIFVAANLNFTQGTTNSPVTVYQVPGYEHLQVPGGEGEWIGPYTQSTHDINAVFDMYREAFSNLIERQSGTVPVRLIRNVYDYELERLAPKGVDYMRGFWFGN